MRKNKLKYDFPSGIVNEIEKPLRREFRVRKTPIWMYIVILILATIAYFAVARIVDNQATQLELLKKAEASEYAPLCERYLLDAKLSGTSAEQTLKEICL